MNEDNKNIKNKAKSSSKGKLIFTVHILVFLFIIGFFSLYGFAVPDRQFSDNENRVLEQAPVITAQSIFDGSFMKKCETYLSDQFPFRDGAIRIKSYLDRFLGKTKENGAYIGKNGFLFDSQTEFNKPKMAELAKTVNSFSNKNPELNITFALSPNSSCVYSEYLPYNLELKDQNSQIKAFYSYLDSKINTVDAFTALSKSKKEHQVFYKTDHHWTTRGAYAVYEALSEPLGTDTENDSLTFYNVANSFKGTLSSKVTSSKSTDCVEICLDENLQGNFFIDFYGEKEKSSSFFYKEKLSEKNNYEVFLGGNYGKLSITTKLSNDKKLIVIKDSFANCLLPMLAPHYSKILVLDPRYMTESVADVIQEDEFTDLLFLYNANTLFEDVSLKTVLE